MKYFSNQKQLSENFILHFVSQSTRNKSVCVWSGLTVLVEGCRVIQGSSAENNHADTETINLKKKYPHRGGGDQKRPLWVQFLTSLRTLSQANHTQNSTTRQIKSVDATLCVLKLFAYLINQDSHMTSSQMGFYLN